MAHTSDLSSLRRPGAQTQRDEDDAGPQKTVDRPQDSSKTVHSASQEETQVNPGVFQGGFVCLFVYLILVRQTSI